MSETGNNLRQIAQVLKSNGTDGELVMGFRDIAPEDINTKEPVFIYFDGLPVPFFMDSFVQRGSSKALVHLTDIRNFEDAEELVGKAVYADPAVYEEEFEEGDYRMLVGWTLLKALLDESTDLASDELDVEETGEITEFMDIPGNPCIEVTLENNGEKVILPLHEDLILSVDPENREIIMEIPEGLL